MIASAIAYTTTFVMIICAAVFVAAIMVDCCKGKKPTSTNFWNLLIYLSLAWLCAYLGGI